MRRCYSRLMEATSERLALEGLLETLPGVVDFDLERDIRGAIVQVRALVADRQAGARLHEMIVRTVGRHFAEERLFISTPAERARVRLIGVTSTLVRERVRVEVTVGLERASVSKSCSGLTDVSSRLVLAASATAEAVAQLLRWEGKVPVEEVGMVRLGGRRVSFAVLRMTRGGAVVQLYGMAETDGGLIEDAAARAVLDALNRAAG